MTQHEMKLNTRYFDSINNGIRTFDIRKANPKYRIGDTIRYECVDDDGKSILVPNYRANTETPLKVYVAIVYILTHEDHTAIPEDYCILGIKKMMS